MGNKGLGKEDIQPILDELKTDVSRARRLFGKEG